MRWPFRRRDAGEAGGDTAGTAGTGGPAVPGTGTATAASAPVTGAALTGPAAVGQRPTRRDWARLAPLPLLSGTPPLTTLPELLPPPLPGPRLVHAPVVPPPVGQVTGLAGALSQALEPLSPVRPAPGAAAPAPEPAEQSAAELASAPLVHRTALPRPVETASMVTADDEYVGAPRVGDGPYRPPAWMQRRPPDWMLEQAIDQAGDAEVAGPGLPYLPIEPELPITRAQLAPPPRLDTLTSGQSEAGADSALPAVRRPNLGQSRRLGLGTPLSRPAGTAFVPPESAGDPGFDSPALEHPALPAPLRQQNRDLADDMSDLVGLIAAQQAQQEALQSQEAREAQEALRAGEAELARQADLARAALDERPADTGTPPGSAGPRVHAPDAGTGGSTGPPPQPLTHPAPARTTGRVVAPGGQRPREVVRPTYQSVEPSAPRLRPAPPARTVRVPTDLAAAMRGSHGVEVADIPVRTGADVTAQARRHGARAFARQGEVYLPDDLGSVDSQAARGPLAHELIHVVQQRTLGAALPAPNSPAGQELEAEALAAGQYHGGEPGAPEPQRLIHAPAVTGGHGHGSDHTQFLTMGGGVSGLGAPSPGRMDDRTRAEVSQIAEERAREVVDHHTRARGSTTGSTTTSGTGTGSTTGAGAGAQPSASAGIVTGEGQFGEVTATSLSEWRPVTGSGGSSGSGSGGTASLRGGGGQSTGPSRAAVGAAITAATSGGGGGLGGGGLGGGGSFDRGAVRAQLIAQHLEQSNLIAQQNGGPQRTELTQPELNAIDQQVDEAQRTGSVLGGLGGASSALRGGFSNEVDGSTFGEVDATDLRDANNNVLGAAPPGDSATGAGGTGAGSGSGTDAMTSGGSTTGRTGPTPPTGDPHVRAENIDLTDLANAIYDRVRTRLRSELMIDRERAGRLADFR